MAHRIEVALLPERPDPAGHSLVERLAEDLAIRVGQIRLIDVYTVDADLDASALDRVRTDLLTDPIIQTSSVDSAIADDFDFLIEVGFRPGVTDNVGRSAREGIEDTLGTRLPEGSGVYKSTQYAIKGCTAPVALRIAEEALANGLIERYAIRSQAELDADRASALLPLPVVKEGSSGEVREIGLDLGDEALAALSREMTLALDLGEMKAIQAHYRDTAHLARRSELGLPPSPTDLEIEVLAQTWSEHCKHKIFSARIEYVSPEGERRVIDSLFKTYIQALSDKVSQEVDWLVSVFHDNAGLIRFDEEYLVALKAETHNSPSALDPYGGAITGIVGVNRDILGAGMGCRCLFNTDVFCFASPFYEGNLPPRLFHPRRVLRGVHAGVRDGGNQSGIPVVNGAIVFHERFLGKPLVFCGTGGLIPRIVAGKASHEKAARPGDLIVMSGGRIGKDGIHGATFSSEELHEDSPATAVQIGDPITQKKMADFLIEARDLALFSCITDNGAGGLSSSIGEMAKDPGGAVIHLERAPLKYHGLAPWEIFLSEAQERMTLAVPPEKIEAFLELSERRAVESTVLGAFTDSGYLECMYEGRHAGALSMDFLHNGVPRMHLEASLAVDSNELNSEVAPEIVLDDANLTADLKAVLAAPNVCSKESFVRMYDHEVQGHSVLKPFQGADHDGPGDAAVIRPVPGSQRGLAIACGICPKYSDLDTYRMMACAVDEAVRNLIAVGGQLGTIAGLDNFCWPDPVASEKNPDGAHKLAQLVRCCEALYDTCLAYGIPLISGKDSMKNDYRIGDTKISIPPTVLFTAAAIVDDVRKTVSMDTKNPGDLVYVLGETKAEMGGSEYLALRGQLGRVAPAVDTSVARALYTRLSAALQEGLVASCHDCSDGGLAVALAESAFAGGFGMRVDLRPLGIEDNAVLLFSETQSRFVVTVPPHEAKRFEQVLAGSVCARVGEVTPDVSFDIVCHHGKKVSAQIEELKCAWQRTLQW